MRELLARLERLEGRTSLLQGELAGTASKSPSVLAPIQTTWYLDPGNSTGKADDRNDGLTAATPLLTAGQLEARVGWSWLGLSVNVDVFVLSDFPNGAPTWTILAGPRSGFRVWIHGTQKTVFPGVLTASTAVNMATNSAMTVTCATAPWAANVGASFFKVTSGPNSGLVAPLRANLGAGVARLGALGSASPTVTDVGPISSLVGNESFSLVAPTQVPNLNVLVAGPSPFTAGATGNLVLTDIATPASNAAPSSFAGSGFVQAATCIFNSAIYAIEGGGFNQVACIQSGQHRIHANNLFTGGCGYGIAGGTFIEIDAGGIASGDDWGLENNAELSVVPGGLFSALTVDAFNCALPFIVEGEFRLTKSGHVFWGSGNSICILDILAGGTVTFNQSGMTIYITGSGGGYSDFLLDGLASTSFFRTDTGVFAGPVSCSFANLVAVYGSGGFNGSVRNIASGAQIVASSVV